jgi:hypothetical protein
MIKKIALALILLCGINTAPCLAQGIGGGLKNGLPQTNMDSFVYEAGAYREFIYGDEGVYLPPYFGFTKASRIDSGIFDMRDQGLTTGHGSWLPDAWGRDEFLGQEWSKSGPDGQQSGQGYPDGTPDMQDPAGTAPVAPGAGPGPGSGVPGPTPGNPDPPEYITPPSDTTLPKSVGQSPGQGRPDPTAPTPAIQANQPNPTVASGKENASGF